MTVDVHTHFLPRDVVHAASLTTPDEAYTVRIVDGEGTALFVGEGRAAGFEIAQLVDPQRRMRDMAAMGVDRQVLSVPPPFGFFNSLEPALSLQLCRELNDRLSVVIREHPDRFLGMATVPLNEPTLAAAELRRCVDELGLHGVEIPTRVNQRNLDDRGLWPFYAAAEDLGVPVFVHSTRGLGADRLSSYHLGNLIGNPTEDAIASASLIFGGVLDEFPGLKVYLAHGGGSCPYLAGRWDQGWRVRPEAHKQIASPPSSYLRRLSFDSLTHSDASLRFLIDVAGAEQVMLGTDYPYDMGEADPVGAVTRLHELAESDRSCVLTGNASRMFGSVTDG